MVVISIFFLLEEIAWTLSWLSFAEIKWCAAFAPLMLKFLDSFGYLSLFPWKELQIWCAQLWMTDCHSIQKRHRKAWVPLTSILKCGSRFGWLESRGKVLRFVICFLSLQSSNTSRMFPCFFILLPCMCLLMQKIEIQLNWISVGRISCWQSLALMIGDS